MSTISSGTTSTTTLIHSGDTTGSLVFKTNDTGSGGTTAMTIDTSQRVGINNSSPSAPLDVTGTIKSSTYSQYGSNMYYGIGNALSGSYASTDLAIYNGANGNSVFLTNNTERMRIDSSGNLLVGTTSGPANKGIVNLASNKTYQVNGTSVSALAWVNFNGTVGPDATRRASYNVSSVTKNSTGDYTVNFANALTDANYSATATNSGSGATAEYSAGILSMTSSAVRVYCFKSGVGAGDPTYFCVTVHGN